MDGWWAKDWWHKTLGNLLKSYLVHVISHIGAYAESNKDQLCLKKGLALETSCYGGMRMEHYGDYY